MSVEFGWNFFTATILKKTFVNRIPESLSAFPEIFELENETQGGEPIMTSVFGKASISLIFLKSSMFLIFCGFFNEIAQVLSLIECTQRLRNAC